MSHDLDHLRRAHPAPAPITLSDDQRARLGSRIDQEVGRHETRRRLARGVAASATVIVCATGVATVAGLALTGSDTSSSTGDPRPDADPRRPVVTSARATAVLDGAAARAGARTAPSVREDQFVYTRSVAVTNEGALGGEVSLGVPHERETWLGQDPGPYGWHDDVIRELGQDWPLESHGPVPAGPDRPTYAWLASLPTDPDALLDVLAAAATPVDGQEQDQATFDLVGTLLSEQLLPPETAAALCRAVTRLDGVEVEPGATDALGRRGVGIARSDARFRTRTTWVFDRRTYELLGTRWYVAGPDGSLDTLLGATAVQESAVVDRAGQVPGSAT